MMLRYIITKTAQYCSETISQIYYKKPTKVWGKNFVHLNACNYNSHVLMNSYGYTRISTVTEFSHPGDKKKGLISKEEGV